MELITRISNSLRYRYDSMRQRPNRIALYSVLELMSNARPVPRGDLPVTLLSMVHKRDTLPYILAARSFLSRVPAQRVIVVSDPTLDDSCQSIIRRHLPHIEFTESTNWQHRALPTGGTWERLQAIAGFCRNQYVVQLDADTLSISELPEVRQAIAGNSSFVLSTEDRQVTISLENAAQWARNRAASKKVIPTQLACEINLDSLLSLGLRSYIRGCSGFAGFHQGSINIEQLLSVSSIMSSSLGARWSEWGTEQFTSNLLCSNSNQFVPLPHPKYTTPSCYKRDETAFLHFIGYERFETPLYATLARIEVKSIATSC